MNALALEHQFEGSLEAWEVHVGACRSCLVHGNGQCYEGEYLSEKVAQVRGTLLKAEIRSRVHGPAPVDGRRPTFPGVPA